MACLQVTVEPFRGGVAQEDDAGFAPFPDDAELASLQVDVVAVEPGELRESEPRAEEGLDQSAIAQAAQIVDVGSGEQPAQLVAVEKFQGARRGLAELDAVGSEHLETL